MLHTLLWTIVGVSVVGWNIALIKGIVSSDRELRHKQTCLQAYIEELGITKRKLSAMTAERDFFRDAACGKQDNAG
jgi:hypothetical protein